MVWITLPRHADGFTLRPIFTHHLLSHRVFVRTNEKALQARSLKGCTQFA
jgi:hypothetical protein